MEFIKFTNLTVQHAHKALQEKMDYEGKLVSLVAQEYPVKPVDLVQTNLELSERLDLVDSPGEMDRKEILEKLVKILFNFPVSLDQKVFLAQLACRVPEEILVIMGNRLRQAQKVFQGLLEIQAIWENMDYAEYQDDEETLERMEATASVLQEKVSLESTPVRKYNVLGSALSNRQTVRVSTTRNRVGQIFGKTQKGLFSAFHKQ